MASTKLCLACQAALCSGRPPIPRHWGKYAYFDPSEDQRHPHHETLESFLGAVDEGCAICTRTRMRLSDSLSEMGYPASATLSSIIDQDEGCGWFTTWVLVRNTFARNEDSSRGELDLELIIVVNLLNKWPTDWAKFVLVPVEGFDRLSLSGQHLQGIGASTGSDEIVVQAMKWYTECTASHEACNSQDPDFVPTRLLQVGRFPSDTVKLIICGAQQPDPDQIQNCSYATLSHCWGGADIPTLNSHTIEQFIKGISIASLPKTFAEAISTASRMGIAYLWIDSLCILQDSTEDWAAEAGVMGNIYSNSALNIMATASRNSYEGIWRQRDPESIRPMVVDTLWTDNEGGCPLSVHSQCYLLEQDLWRKSVDKEPLSERAWVGQERALAPRALHFGREQVFWECRCLNACETYPSGLPHNVVVMTDRMKIPEQARSCVDVEVKNAEVTLGGSWSGASQDSVTAEQPTGAEREVLLAREERRQETLEMVKAREPSNRWNNWIRVYSAAKLTYRSDKLIALSGLAKRMRSLRNNDCYLAGLWGKDLSDQLAWFAFGPDIREPTSTTSSFAPDDMGIPTWSWASVDTAMVPGYILCPGRNLLGRYIEVLDAKTFPNLNGDETMTISGGELRLKCSKVSTGFLSSEKAHIDALNSLFEVRLHPDEIILDRVPAVFVLIHSRRVSGPGITARCFVLILQPAENRPQGYYRRVGLSKYEYNTECHPDLETVFAGTATQACLFLENTSDVLVII